MAAFNKFNLFVQDLEEGKHDFASGGGTYKVMLTNTAPVATNHVYADISAGDLATTGGYTNGGATVAQSDANASGTETVSSATATWTASGAGFGPFRYAVLYGGVGANTGLVGWWDYGSALSLSSAGSTFSVTFSTGVFTLA